MTRARDLAAFVSNADGDIKFDTDTLFIDSSANRVGIGRTDPAHPLDIQNDSASRHLRVFRNASGTSAIMVQNSDTGSGSSNGLQLSVISGGDAQVANLENTNLRFLTNSAERMRVLAGGGLTFNGDTAAANALDDYEYGSFTPTYGGGTTDPSGVTYDPTVGNEGVYVKVGRLVFIQINIRTDAISNVGAGDLRIKGLPFAAASLSGQGGVGSLAVSQSKDFAGEVPSAAYITEGDSHITLFYRTSADGNALSSATSDLGTGTNDNLIRIGGTYYSTA